MKLNCHIDQENELVCIRKDGVIRFPFQSECEQDWRTLHAKVEELDAKCSEQAKEIVRLNTELEQRRNAWGKLPTFSDYFQDDKPAPEVGDV